jgi:predicted dehydrogenase
MQLPSPALPRRSFLGAMIAAASASSFAQTARARIGVAQIGTQHAHASGKMDAVRRLGELYEVHGLSGGEGNKAEVYQGLTLMSESEILSDPRVEAVLVETSIEEACATALRTVRAGKHVHLDKPGALDHDEFKAMRLEAEQRRKIVQMGYMLRYNPAFELLFQAQKEGWLGEILEIDAMMGKFAEPALRSSLAKLPGGGMFELACHIIDAAITLLGKPAQVHAFSTPNTPEDHFKDNQLAVLVYPKATVTIRCNHNDPFGGPRRRFQVAGTKGSMEILPLESGRATLWLSEARGQWKKGVNLVTLPLPKGRYDAEFVALAAMIRGETQERWIAAHDVAVHETVLRASGVLV